MIEPEDVLIVEALRTPIGSPYRSLRDVPAAELAAVVIKEIGVRQRSVYREAGECVVGNVIGAGLGQNLACQILDLAEFPADRIVGYAVNCACGSGLWSVILGSEAVRTGRTGWAIAGGTESVSLRSYILPPSQTDPAYRDQWVDSLEQDGLFCRISGQNMGQIMESAAAEHAVARGDMDLYAFQSHLKAARAQQEGLFGPEICFVIPKSAVLVDRDDRIRAGATLETFHGLPSVFKSNGRVTSGNAAKPSDGAAFLLLSSGAIAHRDGMMPLARVTGWHYTPAQPGRIVDAGVAAIRGVLERCRLAAEDIDYFELGEPFAIQPLVFMQQLHIPCEKVNIFGSDIALGDPLGASGARALVTLTHILRHTGKRYGLVCVTFGGGGAIAMVIEGIEKGL